MTTETTRNPRRPDPHGRGIEDGGDITASVRQIADLARDSNVLLTDESTGKRFLVIPSGANLHEIEPFESPARTFIKQSVVVDDVESFTDYLNVYGNVDHSRVFADTTAANPSMVAVLDYHYGITPNRASHVVIWPMPLSEQWKRWTGIDGVWLDQKRFAEFIEENQVDVVEPSGADMLEIALTLQAQKNVAFNSGIRLNNTTTQLVFNETVDGKAGADGRMEIPAKIKLGIPVFFGGDSFAVPAFLRYRIEGGKLGFKVDLHRRRETMDSAIGDSITKLAAETGLTVTKGKVASPG